MNRFRYLLGERPIFKSIAEYRKVEVIEKFELHEISILYDQILEALERE